MAFKIHSSEKISVNTSATTVPTAYRTFLIANPSSATVYFTEASDGTVCTAQNGFPVLPGETLPIPFSAEILSVTATASGEVYLLYGQEE